MISQRIKEIRQDLKMKQSEMSKILGISQAYLSRLEAGKHVPSSMLTKSISREFNVNEEWLLTGQGDKYNQAAADVLELSEAARGTSPSDRKGNLKADAIIKCAVLYEIYPLISKSCQDMEQFISLFQSDEFADIFNAAALLFLSSDKDKGRSFSMAHRFFSGILDEFETDQLLYQAKERLKRHNQQPLVQYLHNLFMDYKEDGIL